MDFGPGQPHPAPLPPAAQHSILARAAPLVSALHLRTSPPFLLTGSRFPGLGLPDFLGLAPSTLRALILQVGVPWPDSWPWEALRGQEELMRGQAGAALGVALTVGAGCASCLPGLAACLVRGGTRDTGTGTACAASSARGGALQQCVLVQGMGGLRLAPLLGPCS